MVVNTLLVPRGDKPYMIVYGKKIRQIRQKRVIGDKVGMTLVELGKATGLSVGFLSDIENGNRKPGYASICMIAKALDVQVDTLFRLKLKGGNGNGKN